MAGGFFVPLLAARLATALQLATGGLPVWVQQSAEAISGPAERLVDLADVQVRCDALPGMSERPLHHDKLLPLIDHQRALRVPKIVHPYGRPALAFDPESLQCAVPDDEDMILLERAAGVVREHEVVVVPGQAGRLADFLS